MMRLDPPAREAVLLAWELKLQVQKSEKVLRDLETQNRKELGEVRFYQVIKKPQLDAQNEILSTIKRATERDAEDAVLAQLRHNLTVNRTDTEDTEKKINTMWSQDVVSRRVSNRHVFAFSELTRAVIDQVLHELAQQVFFYMLRRNSLTSS